MTAKMSAITGVQVMFEEVLEYIKRLNMRIEKLEKDNKELGEFIMKTTGKNWQSEGLIDTVRKEK